MKEITDALHALWGLLSGACSLGPALWGQAPKLSAGAWPQSKAI